MILKRLLSASVLFAAIPAFAQVGPGGGHGMGRGPMGLGAMRNPVTNAPYSATFTSTFAEKLQDGTALNSSTTRVVYRDSLGRTREEVTMPARGGADAAGKSHTIVMIMDPVSHTVTQLRAAQKVAVVHALLQPSPTGVGTEGAPMAYPHGPRENRNEVKTDLGAKTISGVVANGTRTTRTIPTGEIGNAAPVISTHEDWYSPDLKIEVSRTDVDPFHGTRTTFASALSKAEPDAALFAIPGGYAVQQAATRGHRGPGASRHGDDMPPPASVDAPAPGL